MSILEVIFCGISRLGRMSAPMRIWPTTGSVKARAASFWLEVYHLFFRIDLLISTLNVHTRCYILRSLTPSLKIHLPHPILARTKSLTSFSLFLNCDRNVRENSGKSRISRLARMSAPTRICPTTGSVNARVASEYTCRIPF